MDRLAEIRKIYFATTRATIAKDFDRAIDLLKEMGTEEERERATVFMDGLAEMRAEWTKATPESTKARPAAAKTVAKKPTAPASGAPAKSRRNA